MLGNVFYWVLNMSITATAAGLLISAVHKIKVIPRRIVCLLWGIPFIRMTVPFGLTSEYSLISLFSKFAAKTVLVREGSGVIPDATMMNYIGCRKRLFPDSLQREQNESVIQYRRLHLGCGGSCHAGCVCIYIHWGAKRTA